MIDEVAALVTQKRLVCEVQALEQGWKGVLHFDVPYPRWDCWDFNFRRLQVVLFSWFSLWHELTLVEKFDIEPFSDFSSK